MMKRKSRRSFLGMGAAMTAMLPNLPTMAGTATKPNILFVAFDDMNDWVGCYGGHPNAQTPNLDAFASGAVRFTNAHCAFPLCGPSRFSTMFGSPAHKVGIYGNSKGRISAVAKTQVSMFEAVQKNGYHTLSTGKIFHGSPPDSVKQYIETQGPNYSSGPKAPDDPFSKEVRKKLGSFFGSQPMDIEDDKFTDVRTRKWAVEQLKQDYDRPFFMAVGFFRPHGPWTAPRRYFDQFDKAKIEMPLMKEDDLDDIPQEAVEQMILQHSNGEKFKAVQDKNILRDFVHGYLACHAFADDQFGHLMDALKNSKYAENTIVLVWSDHGYHFGEKERIGKQSGWQESSRTILMARQPGITTGEACDEPVNLLDLYPTVCEYTASPMPQDQLAGESLVPLIRNPLQDTDRVSVTAILGPGNFSVRSKDWAYIRYAGGGEELYDRKKDPNEWINLAKNPEYQAVKEKLKLRLIKEAGDIGSSTRGGKSKKK